MGVGQGAGRDHLKRMDVSQAFAEYEAARHRLPDAVPAGPPRTAPDLGAIADAFDVFFLDAFGVLNIGEDAIPGAPERVKALQAAGKRVMVLTNAASTPRAQLVQKYARLGFRFAPEDVVSSRGVLLDALRAGPPRRLGVMAVPELQENDLDDLDPRYLGDDPDPYDTAEDFVLLGSAGWTEDRQARLEAALRDRPRPVWVGNPDLVAPRADGFSIEPGHYAHRLAALPGIAPRFFGKPFANMFDHAAARLGPAVDRARIVMVGDSLHTDILGARSYGIASALVAGYGFLAGQSVPDAIARSGIVPDIVLDRP